MEHAKHAIFETRQARHFIKHANHAIFWSTPSTQLYEARQARKHSHDYDIGTTHVKLYVQWTQLSRNYNTIICLIQI